MKMLRITLEGKSYDVGVEVLDGPTAVQSSAANFSSPVPPPATQHVAAPPTTAMTGGGRVVTSPMAGLVFKCLVKPGDVVVLNQVVIVLDAMKMETPVSAPVAGTVTAVLVKVGDAVDEGHSLLQIDGGPQ
jgi:biotin carboxyl carrier protein